MKKLLVELLWKGLGRIWEGLDMKGLLVGLLWKGLGRIWEGLDMEGFGRDWVGFVGIDEFMGGIG